MYFFYFSHSLLSLFFEFQCADITPESRFFFCLEHKATIIYILFTFYLSKYFLPLYFMHCRAFFCCFGTEHRRILTPSSCSVFFFFSLRMNAVIVSVIWCSQHNIDICIVCVTIWHWSLKVSKKNKTTEKKNEIPLRGLSRTEISIDVLMEV